MTRGCRVEVGFWTKGGVESKMEMGRAWGSKRCQLPTLEGEYVQLAAKFG